jgi:hypothetical protein
MTRTARFRGVGGLGYFSALRPLREIGCMSDKRSKTVPVKFSEVLDAFEFANVGGTAEFHAYIGLDTGKVYFVSGQDDLDEEVPDDIDESDDYLPLPDKRNLDLGSRLVFAFAEQVIPDDYDTVRDIFRRKGAYGRFKDFLDSEGMLERWYDFEAKATESALRAWCQEHGITLKDD